MASKQIISIFLFQGGIAIQQLLMSDIATHNQYCLHSLGEICRPPPTSWPVCLYCKTTTQLIITRDLGVERRNHRLIVLIQHLISERGKQKLAKDCAKVVKRQVITCCSSAGPQVGPTVNTVIWKPDQAMR